MEFDNGMRGMFYRKRNPMYGCALYGFEIFTAIGTINLPTINEINYIFRSNMI